MRTWLFALGLVALTVGCGKPPEPVTPPLGQPSPGVSLTPTLPDGSPTAAPTGKAILIITNASSDFWNAVDKGLQDAGAELGVPVRMERNDGTVEQQIKLLENALAQKDELLGVAVSVFQSDAPGITEAMAKLAEAGVPLITVDSDGGPEVRRAFVGTNNREAGIALGKKAAELMPDGANYCLFVGTTSAQNARERAEGFAEGAGPKFKLLETYQDDVDFNRAQSNVETALAAHKEANLLVGLWSYNGPIIADAVAAAGKQESVRVICFDAAENLLPLLESGAVKASAVQNPWRMGNDGAKLLKALADGDEAKIKELLGDGQVLDTGITVVTPESFAEFRKFMDEKGLKSS